MVSKRLLYKSGRVQNLIFGIFLDVVNVTNVKLCMMFVHVELYLFVHSTVSMTLTFIQSLWGIKCLQIVFVRNFSFILSSNVLYFLKYIFYFGMCTQGR